MESTKKQRQNEDFETCENFLQIAHRIFWFVIIGFSEIFTKRA